MEKEDIDYSLYLVTDSTPEILGNRDICQVVEAALEGGVTIVQYRDKTNDTGELVRVARELHRICKRFNVPLLINDRVDVALVVGCEGVHVGQDDMDYNDARRLLGPSAIIGVSAGTREEAQEAARKGADYLGIGAMFSTNTKKNTKNVLGTEGVGHILDSLDSEEYAIPCVGIGGINLDNLSEVMSINNEYGISLDGVAVVSAIMAAPSPKAAARELLDRVYCARDRPNYKVVTQSHRVQLAKRARMKETTDNSGENEYIKNKYVQDLFYKRQALAVIKAVKKAKPISHNMTNLVVQNFAANIALAVGASPIMANYGEEAADLAKLGGALVINMGTVTPEGLQNYLQALRAYNQAGRPVVFDPVGAGATRVRRHAAQTILSSGQLSVIKGNEGEIKTLYDIVFHGYPPFASSSPDQQQQQQQRGVDSTPTLNTPEKAHLVRRLACQLRAVIVLTGPTDLVSDGPTTLAIDNGHPILGEVTGTGCVLGTTISAMVAAYPADSFVAVVAGIYLFEIAAERVAKRVDGPGSFVPAFIDELVRVREETFAGDTRWLEGVRAYII